MNSKKLIVGSLVSLMVLVSGVAIFSFDSSNQPPTLEIKPSFQGYLKSDKKDYKCLLEFEKEDKEKWELTNKKGKSLRSFKFTNKNGGLHSIFFDEETTAEDIIEGMNPSARVVAIAFYDASVDKFRMTEQCAYDEKNIIEEDPDDLVIPAGQVAILITAGDTEVINARDGKYQTDYVFRPCDQTNDGWYNYAMTKNGPNLNECIDSVKDFFVQTDDNPVKWEKLDTSSKILNYKPTDYYLAWVNFKEKPKKGAVTNQNQYPPSDLTASVIGTTLNLSWKAPSSTTGLIGYEVLIKKSGTIDVNTTVINTVTSYELKNVVEGTTYNISIGAKYDSGTKSIETTYTVPKSGSTAFESGITDFSVVSATEKVVTLKWKKDSGLKYYRIEYKKSTDPDSTYATSYKDTMASTGEVIVPIESLTPNTEYQFRVKLKKGTNLEEISSPSNVVTAKTLAANEKPQAVTINTPKANQEFTLNAQEKISFTWAVPADSTVFQKGADGKHYRSFEWKFYNVTDKKDTWALPMEWKGDGVSDLEADKMCHVQLYNSTTSAALSTGKDWICNFMVLPQERFEAGKEYSFSVRVFDGKDFSDWSEAVKFKIYKEAAAQAYNPPSSVSLNYFDDLEDSFRVSWTAPSSTIGLTGYEINIYKDNSTTALITATPSASDTMYDTKKLEAGSYKAVVFAKYGSNKSTSVEAFKTILKKTPLVSNVAPSSPKMIIPAKDQTFSLKDQTFLNFHWEPSQDSTLLQQDAGTSKLSYEWKITDGYGPVWILDSELWNFPNVIDGDADKECQKELTYNGKKNYRWICSKVMVPVSKLTKGWDYKISVRAFDGELYSAWSEPVSFKTSAFEIVNWDHQTAPNYESFSLELYTKYIATEPKDFKIEVSYNPGGGYQTYQSTDTNIANIQATSSSINFDFQPPNGDMLGKGAYKIKVYTDKFSDSVEIDLDQE